MLEEERLKASFDVAKMTNILDGGEEYTGKRRWIENSHKDAQAFVHAELPRDEQVRHSIKHFMDVHKAHLGSYKPKDMDMSFMSNARMTRGIPEFDSVVPISSPLTINFGVFSSTIRSQCSDEQKSWWLEAAMTGQMIGCYAQTELGHGSNVRGISTQATFDPANDEWVLHTPSVAATKWWSTSLPCSTHAIVFAQLNTAGKSHGLHMFMVQLRGADLKPLPGVELGDVGAMLGENDATIGYARFSNLRIPRRHLLERRQHVTAQGEYCKGPPKGSMKAATSSPAAKSKSSGSVGNSGGSGGKPVLDEKMAQAMKYITMMKTRIALAATAAGALAKACTISARYSCVRRQGFKNTSQGQRFDAEENQIIDYSVQRYRVLKWTAAAYALKAATQWMIRRRHEVERNKVGGEIDVSDLPEVHATGAGLKALACCMAADGIEDLRRSCGGHGFLMSSGIAPLEADFKGPNTTAEGDFVLLSLQTSRFLLKSMAAAKRGEPLSGLTQCLEPFKDPGFDPHSQGREVLNLAHATTVEEFLNPDYLVKLFELRTLTAIHKAYSAVQRSVDSGKSQDEARNASARLLYTTTKSHVRYFIISKFAINITTVQDQHCKAVLAKLCALFAVADLLEGEQWIGLLNAQEADLLEEAAHKLCSQLRPDAVALTDAFEIPDRVLNSTLGRRDGNVYEALLEEARHSRMNVDADGEKVEVPVFMKELEPYLDLDLLRLANKQLPHSKL